MSTQTTPQIKLLLHTAHLARVQAFYSALGIRWSGGDDQRFDESFRPTKPSDVMGLPFLQGDFENMELFFYFREPNAPRDLSNTVVCVRFSDPGEAAQAIKLLKESRTFQPAPEFDDFNLTVIDPDGRYVMLCDPHPFSVI